jgi:rsbT co-antagonist protein RsbR
MLNRGTRMNQLVLENLSLAVMSIDKDFTITVANHMCKTILGIEPKEAIGRNIDEFFNYPPEFTRTLQHTLERGKSYHYEVFPYNWGPYEKTLSQRSLLLKDENGEIAGAMIEFEDITERHREQEEYQAFMEEIAISIIPLEEKIGMIVLQNLPFDLGIDGFNSLCARAMERTKNLKLRSLVLDASSLPAVRILSSIQFFKNILSAFRLIGIEIVIAGIHPDVAIQVVKEGIDFTEIETFANLIQALEFLKANQK